MRTSRFILGGLGIFFAAVLSAQDVMVGPPVVIRPATPTTVEPRVKGLRPEYPDELRVLKEPGYAFAMRYVDAKGDTRSVHARATHLSFQRAVEAETKSWDVVPAQQNGRAVDTEVWVPVIFNPASAAKKGPEATPRLEAVYPAYIPARRVRDLAHPTVNVRFSVDATGAITAARCEPEATAVLREAVQTAAKHWRFSPARHEGHAIAADVVVPVFFQAEPRGDEVPPKVLTREEPEFPRSMARSGVRGEVEVGFFVDQSGHVIDPFVLHSTNPAFDAPALVAVRQWTFTPGTRDGEPTKMRMAVTLNFTNRRRMGGGTEAFEVTGAKDQSKLPPEFRYDTPPKPRGTVLAVYPYQELRDGVSGKAMVAFLINSHGRIQEAQATGATNPEFAGALVAAVEAFQFDPALKDGKPTRTIMTMELEFSVNGFVHPGRLVASSTENELIALEKKHPERIATLRDVDAKPKPVSRRAPVYPSALRASGRSGETLVEFLIDEDGAVRLPRVVSATDPAFGFAGVQAISAWRFEPLKVHGKPAVVRVQIPLRFDGPEERKPAIIPPAAQK